MVLSINVNGTKLDIIVAVQKSGFAWALDRNNGNLVWSTEAGPGGTLGGGTWGAATDNRRVYTNIANIPYNATTNPVSIANGVLFAGSTYRTGPVYAINAASGEILWSYETGASVYGGLSASKGCVYVGHGFRVMPALTAGNSLFAFCLN
ncbi:UNVERIFIED_CONTAM: hypothetical protein Sangu_1277800 [Sesamum angustifolium]|uniref:Pyrrolo-quinoline quinone repeat domain-containing protein n=1 Tax=Sesamum angustifolium TaxID=2727405 RepID=A0AAW2NJY4_9LAMI